MEKKHIHEYDTKKDSEITNQLNGFSKKLFDSVYQEDGEVDVYGKILTTEEISIVSELMIECDEKFLKGDHPSKGITSADYHPYCCEYITDIESITKKEEEKLTSLVGQWVKFRLAFGKANNKKSMIQGTLVFSASPIIRKKCGVIYILDFADAPKFITDAGLKKYKDFEKYLDKQNEQQQTHTQLNIFPNVKILKSLYGKVYNVGQGNFVYLQINDDSKMFFDVGESKNPQDKLGENYYIEKNTNEITNLKPQYIMISHWDLDHILGVYKFNDKQNFSFYKTPEWIAPDITKIMSNASLSAKRLCAYLLKEGKLNLIDNPNNFFCTIGDNNNGMLRFWQGSCIKEPGTLKNNIGLILEVKIKVSKEVRNNDAISALEKEPKFKKLLFAGDCSYWRMSPDLFDDKYDLIISSHHGAASAVEHEAKFLAPDAQKGARAIISTGYNTHAHPHIEHLVELNYRGFTTYYTSGYQYISFHVSDKINLNIKRFPNKKEQKQIEEKKREHIYETHD